MSEIADDARFEVNAPAVVAEEFDQEIVVVNLETGEYFATRGVGAEIWRRLALGATVGAVLEHLTQRFDASQATVVEACRPFVSKLLDSGLLRVSETADGHPSADDPAQAIPTQESFEAPVLEVYDDMQDLLVLDPIHEVEETGWPHDKGEEK